MVVPVHGPEDGATAEEGGLGAAPGPGAGLNRTERNRSNWNVSVYH